MNFFKTKYRVIEHEDKETINHRWFIQKKKWYNHRWSFKIGYFKTKSDAEEFLINAQRFNKYWFSYTYSITKKWGVL